ncbi:Trk system potassium transporter TrkA [Desulfogranum mediterraneum]|uniref:Trk system potassium transporter TrkA n=1 Tax=Desulfogranum mediterraneum TaxID=160661 RepID=UPI0004037E71|nr:Trk system potassium transporter TrkA [Desulfogranum mediterraneum]
MNILIFGATDAGYMVASHLCQEHNVTVVDRVERIPEAFNLLDLQFIQGSAVDIETLEQAATEKADLIISCSENDEANIVACWTVKKISQGETICFVSSEGLFKSLNAEIAGNNKEIYGIDTLIWPEQLATMDIFRVIMVPEAIDVEYFAGGKVKLFEYRIKEAGSICGRRVQECGFPENVLMVCVNRDHELLIPDGSMVIEAGDRVTFMGTAQGIDTLAARIFKDKLPVKNVAIIGGGNVGYMLAKELEQTDIRVKLIELESDRCSDIAEKLPRTLILNGDGTDISLLEEEAFGRANVTVCVTNNDEKNLLCSLLAKQLGSEKVIARVSNRKNFELFERVGIDVVVSPMESAFKVLLDRLQSEDVDLLGLVEGGKGEILRLTLPQEFSPTPISELAFPVKAVIAVIKRGSRVVVPHGSSRIRGGDRLIIFTMAEDAATIKKLLIP